MALGPASTLPVGGSTEKGKNTVGAMPADPATVTSGVAWYYDALHRRKFANFTDDQNVFRQGKAAMLMHRSLL